VAYYGGNNNEYAEISKFCSFVFRRKGSKFQNLKSLITENPGFFDQYSHVWVCDDDILMSSSQIEEAFDITESLDFWVAQPADRPEGRYSHWITGVSWPGWDYRIVNFVEVRMPIFRRDKLTEFLAVYDGSLVGAGIEWWYANFFKADKFGRFAIIDKVQVTNPRYEVKGGSDIDQLQAPRLRLADWHNIREKHGLVQYSHKVFAYCKLAPASNALAIFLPLREFPTIDSARLEALRRSNWWGANLLVKSAMIVRALLQTARRSGWREAIFLLKCGLSIRRQRRAVNWR
jgi:hypothetical protein